MWCGHPLSLKVHFIFKQKINGQQHENGINVTQFNLLTSISYQSSHLAEDSHWKTKI